jgi:hypothetical protein
MDALIRTIKLIFKITNLHSKGLERSIKDVGAKKRHYLIFLIGFLTLQMKVCHFLMSK